MLVQFRKQLRGIEEELKRLTTLEDADEELFTPIRTMLEGVADTVLADLKAPGRAQGYF